MRATDERWHDEQRTDPAGSAGPEAWHAVGGLHEADATWTARTIRRCSHDWRRPASRPRSSALMSLSSCCLRRLSAQRIVSRN